MLDSKAYTAVSEAVSGASTYFRVGKFLVLRSSQTVSCGLCAQAQIRVEVSRLAHHG